MSRFHRAPLGFAFGLALLAACDRGAPPDRSTIDAAERRWQVAAISSYRLTLRVSGDRVETGDFVIEVRAGKVEQAQRNGQAFTVRDPFYTVAGLFDFLRDELEMAAEPTRYFGVPAANAKDAVHQRVSFDAERGFPRKYLRAVFGAEHNIEIVVSELTPL